MNGLFKSGRAGLEPATDGLSVVTQRYAHLRRIDTAIRSSSRDSGEVLYSTRSVVPVPG
jgi:hypothetical protein